MNVRQLITKLKKCAPDLPVEMFAHDHDPRYHDQGDGEVLFVYEVTDDVGIKKVALGR